MNSLTFLTTSPPEPSHSWHITSTSRNLPEINLCQLHKSSFTGSVLFSDAQEIFTKVEVSFLLQALHGQLELHHLVVEVLYLGLGCRATAAVSCARYGSTRGPGGGPGGGGRLPRLNIAVVSGELIIDHQMSHLGHAGHGRPGPGPHPRPRLVGAAHLLTAPHAQRVVLLPSVVGIKELFEPLDKLKIILESCSN